MIRVWIGAVECEIDSSTQLSLKYDCSDMVNLENCREGKVLSFNIPLSGVNLDIFKIAGDVHPETKFNAEGYKIVVEVDGIEIFDGSAYLTKVVWEQGARYVVVECHGGAKLWATIAAQTLFSQIGIDFEGSLNTTMVESSWSSGSHVKFFPIVRDQYEDCVSSTDMTGVRMVRTIDDYHPFIRLSVLLEKIFSLSGYTVESSIAISEEFYNLYVSGNYSSEENEAARAAMGFYAKRTSDTTTTTCPLGRISLSPNDVVNTIGNIVDIESVESDNECYNYSGVLQIEKNALIFRPTTQISVGFEYYLHYTCECEIESRTKLKGIDTMDLLNEENIEWEITNRHVDYRDSWSSQLSYSLCIFDFEEGQSFRLYGLKDTSETIIMEIDSRITSVSFDQQYDMIYLDILSDGSYTDYRLDWALYSGYIDGNSTTEVKVTVRSAPKEFSPTSPMEFEYIFLMGAAPGMEFTMHQDTSVRPYFASYPGYNSTITYEDIAQQSFSALDFLGALQHLYNLRFLTNDDSKVVTIESYNQFYLDEEYDWSDKVVAGESIEFSDFAFEKYRNNTLGYQQTDGVVQRMGQTDNKYFGEWSYEVDSYAASSTDNTDLNPIFSASTNDEDGVLMVGDRDDLETVDSLSFSPRIARYVEMREIDGENYSLPYVAFHDSDVGFTLCFEDRDGVSGLNRFYLDEVSQYSRCQLLSLALNLSACDYSNLFAPSEGSASLRSRFYFDLQGESFRAILHSIDSYDPMSGVARCSFLTID